MSAAAALRKGWCPGALRPMAARDGLLVRLRITGGIVPAATAHILADLAEAYGNGLFDLTARGNLQMRGVREAALDALLGALRSLGLLDAEPAGEAVRNVLASPLAGLGAGPDIRPLVAALEARLAGDPSLHALPGKFGFLVDDGGEPTLAGVAADARFDWCAASGRFAVALGGTRAGALPVGSCTEAGLVDSAAVIAHGFLRLASAYPETRRMRSLREQAGDAAVAAACGLGHAAPPVPAPRTQPAVVIGSREFSGTPVLGLAAPFGRLDAAMLRAVAHARPSQVAEEHTPSTVFGGSASPRIAREGSAELRLTPWRTIFVLDPEAGLARRAAAAGWIADADDARLAVAACTGRDGCERGTTDTHGDAAALAAQARDLGSGVALHVSGCPKGCAKPSATRMTLVGRDGRYDLVRDGAAGAEPARRGLTLVECRAALAKLAGAEAALAEP